MTKNALVTGGAVRLGAAMVRALVKDGYAVAIHYVGSDHEAQALAAEMRSAGGTVALLQGDLLDLATAEALVPQAVAALGGPLSVLINNASIFEFDTLQSATHDSWDRHLGSNLRAPFVLSQAFAAQAQKGVTGSNGLPISTASIINMIDQRVRKLTPEFMTYTIAKAGLWAFTQTAAQALAPDIRVNAIGPGPTLQGGRQTFEAFARQKAATLLQRGADPSDIVAAMRYLLSSPAITGQLLCVDGGQHLAWETPDVVGVE